MLIEDVEKLVEDYYTRVQITPAQQDALAGMLHHEFDRLMAVETEELERLTTNRDRLESEQDRLMQAHYADAIPLSVLKREQDRIVVELNQVTRRIDAHFGDYADARAHLDDALGLLANCANIYTRCDDTNRRLCNQAFFTKVFIDEDNELRVEHNRPFEMLLDPQVNANALTWAADANKARTSTNVSVGKGSSLVRAVDLGGLEPPTPCMPCRCATSCATDPEPLPTLSEQPCHYTWPHSRVSHPQVRRMRPTGVCSALVQTTGRARPGLIQLWERQHPARRIFGGFVLLNLVGWALLMLPVSRQGSGAATWIEALFTAVSAACVTGLTVVDTALYWTPFGQVVILLLIQLGGLGVMVFASLIGIFVVRRLTLGSRITTAQETHLDGPGGVRTVVVSILRIALVVEGVVALALFARFWLGRGEDPLHALWLAVFHAVSSYNNAGFALFSDNLMGERPVIG